MKPEKQNKTKQQQTSNKIITEAYQSRCYSSWKQSSKASFSTLLDCMQTDTTLLTNNSQHCWMLHIASVCTPCCMLLDVVAQSLKPVKNFSQQLPTFLLFRDRRSVAQQCWIRLHCSCNIVGAAHAHYAWFTKTYGLYPSHDALQVPTLLGVVASVCTPLPTRTQQFPTMLGVVAFICTQPQALGVNRR